MTFSRSWSPTRTLSAWCCVAGAVLVIFMVWPSNFCGARSGDDRLGECLRKAVGSEDFHRIGCELRVFIGVDVNHLSPAHLHDVHPVVLVGCAVGQGLTANPTDDDRCVVRPAFDPDIADGQ